MSRSESFGVARSLPKSLRVIRNRIDRSRPESCGVARSRLVLESFGVARSRPESESFRVGRSRSRLQLTGAVRCNVLVIRHFVSLFFVFHFAPALCIQAFVSTRILTDSG